MNASLDAISTPALTSVPVGQMAEVRRASWLERLRDPLLAIIVPTAVLALWHLATYGRQYSLIPPPTEVARALYDLAFGGIYDDAYSRTLHEIGRAHV